MGDPSAPRSGEFEAMVKVLFADAGDLGQLETTLRRVEEEAQDRIRALADMAARPPHVAERLHISALTLRLGLAQEQAVLDWARWAQDQVRQGRSTADPGTWDARAVLDALARE